MRSGQYSHRLWVSSAGAASGYGIVASVRDVWGRSVWIVCADTNPAELVAASVHADDFVRVPPIAEPAYESVLLAELSRRHVDTYVPLRDEEVVLASELHAEGRLERCVTLAPLTHTSRTCLDKLESGRWLESEGFPALHTTLGPETAWSGSKLLAKPRLGIGSVGVRLITSKADLARLDPTYVVQEYCDSGEITSDCFRSQDGEMAFVSCRERLEVKAGVCTKARFFRDAFLEETAAQIGSGLDLRGVFCIQWMRAGDGAWRITDLNARIGAGTRMGAVLGMDFAAAALEDLWGGDAGRHLRRPDGEPHVVRSYVEWAT